MASSGIDGTDNAFNANKSMSDDEKELLRDELKKTESEIATLKQLLTARQKHAAQLKNKLGMSPLNEISQEVSQGIKNVRDTAAYQKTSQVVAGTADAVRGVLAPAINDIRSSSFFKSFETKMGTAYNSARMAASTSIDHLSGLASSANKTTDHRPNGNDSGVNSGSGPGLA